MYVCICNAVTDSQIRAAVDAGHDSLKALRTHLGVATECGRCARCAADLLKTCKGCGRCKNSQHHGHGHKHEHDHDHKRDHQAARSQFDAIQPAFA